jgi:hypothetical protein
MISVTLGTADTDAMANVKPLELCLLDMEMSYIFFMAAEL